jgi:hypothetical protein
MHSLLLPYLNHSKNILLAWNFMITSFFYLYMVYLQSESTKLNKFV